MRTYDEDFKRHAVELSLNGAASSAQTARDLGIPDTCLGAWKRDCLKKLDGDSRRLEGPSPSELAKEIERLRRENSRLAQQRDILKKALSILGETPCR